jgi:hypothetical protein
MVTEVLGTIGIEDLLGVPQPTLAGGAGPSLRKQAWHSRVRVSRNPCHIGIP